uniref:Peptidase A1 domain-containing protein n=1 Tax=Opuntia streptacantha TaxID=393608 RepID=A0A7C8YDI2_OPUST
MDFSIYSLKTSSTGRKLPCDSPLCGHHASCPTSPSMCPYKVMYLSANTVSSGYLVEDVLHLSAYNNPPKLVNAEITFGCGRNQTGSFLDGGAPNGLLGLGLGSISVPSILASENIAVNSFSMCFGDDGIGRIVFGDQGSSDQGETPFHLRQLNPHYNISVTQITVGGSISHVDAVYAIFDTGTSFTYLNDPAFTLIAEKFDSQVNDSRLVTDSNIPFDYCYESSSSQSSMPTPSLNLTMQGGDQFHVTDPTFPLPTTSGYVYCLGIVKSEDVNIIGQNFMTGYNVVFDRERMVLGWKASDCNQTLDSSTFPVSPRSSTRHPKSSKEPQVTSKSGSSSSGASLTLRRDLSCLKSLTYMLILIFLEVLLII